MTRRRGARALALAAAALALACQPRAREGGPPAPVATPSAPVAPSASRMTGLGPGTAFVTIVHNRRTVPIEPRQVAGTLDTVQRVLDRVDAVAPEPDGARLLANLRLNEYLLDVTIWTPQVLVVGGRRVTGVSGIVIPFTGAWRNRVLVSRQGDIEASPTLLASPDLSALERTVESAGRRP